MSHYEERLERDLARIRRDLAQITADVQNALKGAVHALLTNNREQAYAGVLGDMAINRAVRALDQGCYSFIAVHLPSAGHLRWISSTMRIGIALERIGDYAVTICRETVQLPRAPDGVLAREVELMAKEAGQMLHQSMQAFAEQNAEAAKATMAMADQVERTFGTVFEELIEGGGGWSKRDIYALLVVFHMLERVSDQAKNICEETVFAALGEGKAPKTYRVLFLDEDNAGPSKMAEALGARDYPANMAFASAGRTAAAGLDQAMTALMANRGVDLSEESPKALEPIAGELEEYHVIVSLFGRVADYMERIPFHTVALSWDVGSVPPADAEDAADRWEAIYRAISVRLKDLVDTLHGEGDA